MKTILATALVFTAFGFSLNANAVILSFDETATGVAEMLPDSAPATTCNLPDICDGTLVFSNIGGSGVSATVNSLLNLGGNNFVDHWLWYDLSPAGYGGMGASTQAQATAGNPAFDAGADNAIGIDELIIVTFSQAVTVDSFFINGDHAPHNAIAGIFDALTLGLLDEPICVNSFCDNIDTTGTSFLFTAAQDIQYYLAGLSFRVPAVEPPVVALLGLGLLAMGLARRRLR